MPYGYWKSEHPFVKGSCIIIGECRNIYDDYVFNLTELSYMLTFSLYACVSEIKNTKPCMLYYVGYSFDTRAFMIKETSCIVAFPGS